MTPVRDAPVAVSLAWLLAGLVECPEAPAAKIRGLCHDSRAVRPGDLFFAFAGSRSHGMSHVGEAIAKGACAILYDPAQGGEALAHEASGAPCLPVAGLSRKAGLLADRFFGEPSKHLDVIGITGTNGKTSCSHFLAHALGNHPPAAVIGTLGWGLPEALQPSAHTTPDALEVHALLARLRDRGIGTVAMEASSHGLVQGRLNGVRFRGGLFTNLSRDHLDYHGTMEAYLEAKLRLLTWPGLEFVAFNLDDPSAQAITGRAPAGIRKIGFTLCGTAAVGADIELVSASEIRHVGEGVAFLARFGQASAPVAAPVYGDFNVENLLASLAVLLAKGHDLEDAACRLARVRAVAGRMERFARAGGATVVVDYAHTPDALAKTLTSLRRHCEGALWVVFGCGGNRDRGKRPQMGAIAEKLADRVVVTDDNPRHEDGDAIVAEILSGCRRQDVTVKRDRRAAIAFAIEHAAAGDVVLVAGKGHESTQDIGGIKHPFSDRDVIKSLLCSRVG
jgi:UDP-N-acetylmuramoyl-L-alanyl-D-glutamate--2,6-diaminopimelate ligase